MRDFSGLRTELARLFRFGVVGFTAMGAYWTITVVLTELGKVDAIAASLVGHLFAGVVSYLGHSFYSFKLEPDHGRYLPRFILVAGLTVLFNVAVIWLVVERLRLAPAVGATLVAVLIPCLNYALNRLFVFHPRARHC